VRVAVPAIAHQSAVIVRRLGLFRRPEISQLREKHQNEEDTEERDSEAVDHRIIVARERHYRAKNRNCAENLCHIEFEPLFLP
jgi:hypothetical protein